MQILIWGLGHAGVVCAACFAEQGHDVIGIDTDLTKVAAINSGSCTIREPGLAELVREMVRLGRLRAVNVASADVAKADISFICVGTPHDAADGLAGRQIEDVAQTIAAGLRRKSRYHSVVLRSTVMPGFTRGVLQPLLENASGLRAGIDFGLGMYPEFLREANALADFRRPHCSIFGSLDERTAARIAQLCGGVGSEVVHTKLEEAEMAKLASNAFHALKVGFANEIGRLCAARTIDGGRIMELLCCDTRLNTSSAYLRPGFAFGGHCLPKDVAAIVTSGKDAGVALPILEAVLPSNDCHFAACLAAIRSRGVRRIGLLGLSFKPGTDDLRDSPALRLVAELLRQGYEVLAYDPDLLPLTLSDSNRKSIGRMVPGYQKILQPDLETVISNSSLLVVTQRRLEFSALSRSSRCPVLDLNDPVQMHSRTSSGR